MVDVGAAAPLTVRMGSAIHTFPAGREVLVGRNPACDIRIDAAQDLISRTHLVLHTEGADWVAEDRSSNNLTATMINQAIGMTLVNLGKTEITFTETEITAFAANHRVAMHQNHDYSFTVSVIPRVPE